ncbi:MAG: 50S ribosomal protein L30 [bacterium]|nr:50S ribosomal protein L30 [bacterium]
MKRLKMTLIKSGIGRIPQHRKTLLALGLKRPNKWVIKNDTPKIRGMVNKVSYLVKVEEV